MLHRVGTYYNKRDGDAEQKLSRGIAMALDALYLYAEELANSRDSGKER